MCPPTYERREHLVHFLFEFGEFRRIVERDEHLIFIRESFKPAGLCSVAIHGANPSVARQKLDLGIHYG